MLKFLLIQRGRSLQGMNEAMVDAETEWSMAHSVQLTWLVKKRANAVLQHVSPS